MSAISNATAGCSGITSVVIVSASAIAMFVVGILTLTGGMSPMAGGWTLFTLSLVSGSGVISGAVLPIIALLGAYGVVPIAAAGGLAVAITGLALVIVIPIVCCVSAKACCN